MRFVLSIVFTLVFVAPLLAQTVDLDVRALEVQSLTRDVTRTADRVEAAAQDDPLLIELNRRLVSLSDGLIAEGVELSADLVDVRTQLDQIGAPPPPDGVPEPDETTEARNLLEQQRAELNRLIGLLEQSSVDARIGMDAIADARRELFATTLSQRYDIRDAFSGQLLNDLAVRWDLLDRRIRSWANFTWRTKGQSIVNAGIVIAIVALGIGFISRRMFGGIVRRDPIPERASYFDRLTTGFAYAVLPFLAMLAVLAISYLVLEGFVVLRSDVALILLAMFIAAGIVVLVWRLAEALFSPSRPNWRIVPVADRAAGPLKAFAVAMAAVTAADLLLTQINDIVSHAQTITIAKSMITALATGGLLIAIAYVRPYEAQDESDLLHATGGRWSAPIRYLFVGIGSLLIVSALSGYIGFARFASQQIVVTGTVFVTAFLGLQAAQAIASEGALAGSRIGRWLTDKTELSDTRVEQLGLLSGIVLGALVIVAAIPAIALLWGIDLIVIREWFAWFFTRISIGSITISLTSIAVGIGLFFFGYWVTKRLQSVIDRNVLERSRVESGVRTSIKTAIGYVGVAIAALIGVSAAGFDLSQIALVAGALSVGIGFGLQNIVNNFVSGLILLAERPFKSGDIIEAGGYTGVVRKVNVRATEVELFDKKTVILPNSELINSSVSNWMHKNTLARVDIAVGVAYGTDPQLVMDTLMEIVNDHPRILANPEPFVAFTDFGESSLDFVLYGYLADVSFAFGTRTELRLEIVKRFDALGIEIPFPQRDVNLRMVKEGETEKPETTEEPVFDVIRSSKKPVSEDD